MSLPQEPIISDEDRVLLAEAVRCKSLYKTSEDRLDAAREAANADPECEDAHLEFFRAKREYKAADLEYGRVREMSSRVRRAKTLRILRRMLVAEPIWDNVRFTDPTFDPTDEEEVHLAATIRRYNIEATGEPHEYRRRLLKLSKLYPDFRHPEYRETWGRPDPPSPPPSSDMPKWALRR